MDKLLNINLHFKCNAKCIFCVAGVPDAMRDTQVFSNKEEVFNELQKGFKQGYRKLCLSGGEPTIYENLLEVVKKAKSLGYVYVEVKTNGIKLKDYEFVSDMANAGVDVFCIAIQGPNSEIHDKLVGVPGAFDAIMSAVESVHSLGKTLVTPTCIQKGNYKALPRTIELLKEINTSFVTPTFIETSGSALQHFNDLIPKYSEVIPYLYEAIDKLNEGKIKFRLHGFPMCVIPKYEFYSLDLFRKNDRLAGTDINDYSQYEKENFRAKCSKCEECVVSCLCSGPWLNYAKIYGFDEFKPIKSDSVMNIIPPSILVRNVFNM